MGSEALCQGLISKSFDENKPQSSAFKNITENKQHTRSASADQGQPIILSSTITSQEITNRPCFPLPSSCPIPEPPTTLSAKTIFTSERLGLVFLARVLPTLSTLCCHQCCKAWQIWEENPVQNLTALKKKDQGSKCCSAGWRTTSSRSVRHPHGHSSHVLFHGSLPLSAQAMQVFLTAKSTLRKQIALMSQGLSCTKQGRSSLFFNSPLSSSPFSMWLTREKGGEPSTVLYQSH